MAKYIPEKHYVTWANFAEETPLAFMTVWGTDAAAKKRMDTADSWVRTKPGHLPVKHTLDNGPLTGFEIAKEVRRWSTSNVVWRVNDPRGFQLEISSGNMAYILGNCTIREGVIEDELIWVRDGQNNYLLPTKSEEFATYQRNSIAKESTTKLSEVNVGDRISLMSGEIGIYLGMYTCVTLGKRWGSDNEIIASKRYHILRNEAKPDAITYEAKTSWKGITIEERGAAENKDYSDEMNANIKSVNGPTSIDYVRQGKFSVDETLATMHTLPFNRAQDSSYFTIFRDNLYIGTVRYDDSWEGSIYPYNLTPATNTAGYDYSKGITVSDNYRTTSIFAFGDTKCIKPDEVAGLEKFVYAVTIDDKEYKLDL